MLLLPWWEGISVTLPAEEVYHVIFSLELEFTVNIDIYYSCVSYIHTSVLSCYLRLTSLNRLI